LALPIAVSGAPVSQVGATIVESATKFDKSDEVLFKAQDEFLRRLKEKSAKGSKPPAPKVSIPAGMTIALPPKPTKSPPPSLAAETKDEHNTDVDLRLGNVDLKKLSKDIDAIINKESRKSDVEDGLTKDYQPDSKGSAESNMNSVKSHDVDMRKEKSGNDSHGSEPKKKRLSIVRPPPSAISRPSTSSSLASSSQVKDESDSRRRLSSSSTSNDGKRKFEGESSDGSSRKEMHAAPRSGESRDGEKESVWRRLSAETFSQRDGKESSRSIDKEDVRRYSEMCDNYYRTYYEEQYGSSKGKKHGSGVGGGSGGGSSDGGSGGGGSAGGRRHEDSHRYDYGDADDRRSSNTSKRRHR